MNNASAARHVKRRAKLHAEFLMFAYYGLVLRGYDNERSIPDPILRKVWRFGKKLATEARK